MNKGDLVEFIDPGWGDWTAPGLVIKGPYGSVNSKRHRIDGKVVLSSETKVVDVLFKDRIFSKIPIENLKVIK